MKTIYFIIGFLLLFSCTNDGLEREEADTKNVLSAKSEKVQVCHYDAENGTYKTLSISQNALKAHLKHGDYSGSCDSRTYVPDDGFEQTLIDLGYDDVLDDYVLTSNINGIESLYIRGNLRNTNYYLIEDLTGIEDFVSLKILELYDMKVQDLDLSPLDSIEELVLRLGVSNGYSIQGFPNLKKIEFPSDGIVGFPLDDIYEYAQLPNIISDNPQLSSIDGWYTSIAPTTTFTIKNNNLLNSIIILGDQGLLDLRLIDNPLLALVIFADQAPNSVYFENVPAIKRIVFTGTTMSEIDLSGLPALESMNLSYSNLTSLDISNNSMLKILTVRGADLTGLDVSNNPLLIYLVVSAGEITSFDVSNNPLLETLYVTASLTSLDVSNNPSLTTLRFPTIYVNDGYLNNGSLTSLDVSNNPLLTDLWVLNHPDLICIQVNQEQLSNIPVNWKKEVQAEYKLDCN